MLSRNDGKYFEQTRSISTSNILFVKNPTENISEQLPAENTNTKKKSTKRKKNKGNESNKLSTESQNSSITADDGNTSDLPEKWKGIFREPDRKIVAKIEGTDSIEYKTEQAEIPLDIEEHKRSKSKISSGKQELKTVSQKLKKMVEDKMAVQSVGKASNVTTQTEVSHNELAESETETSKSTKSRKLLNIKGPSEQLKELSDDTLKLLMEGTDHAEVEDFLQDIVAVQNNSVESNKHELSPNSAVLLSDIYEKILDLDRQGAVTLEEDSKNRVISLRQEFEEMKLPTNIYLPHIASIRRKLGWSGAAMSEVMSVHLLWNHLFSWGPNFRGFMKMGIFVGT